MRAVVRRDLERAAAYRWAVIGTAISGLLQMIFFYYISRLVKVEPFASSDDYFAFAVVGVVALQLAHAALYFPQALLVAELNTGNFERLVVSPLGPVAGLVATMVFPFVSAVGAALGTLALAGLAFGLSLTWSTAPLALPAAILIGFAFAPFGLLFLAAGVLIKQVGALTGWLVTGLSILAGLYYPVDLLPGWIHWASDAQPLTPAVDLLRHLLVGTDLPHPLLIELAKLAAFAALMLPPALWLLSAAIRLGRRRGTIIEY